MTTDDTLEIAAQADAALRTVRVVLGVLSCFVVGGYRPLAGPTSWGKLSGVLVAIIAMVILLNWIAIRVPREPAWIWFTQALDVLAIIGLAIVLDEPLGQQSWVLLVIPVVSAAVRRGTALSVLSWVGGCGGYIAATMMGVIGPTEDVTLLARLPGTLLAVAITIGLLARWMREGWEIQNELTATVAAREHRLGVIERTGFALKNLATPKALELCANQILALGFDASTVQLLTGRKAVLAVGQTEIISNGPGQTSASGPVVTSWVENNGVRVHSVCLHEPKANAIVTGWSELPIDKDKAVAFATLVAHTSTAIETSSLLAHLRHTATHDALTGLANRRTLDRAVDQRATKSGRFALAFVDLDSFKTINDQYGHTVGDEALVAVSRLLERVTGDAGIVARYGGDEFVILLPDAGVEAAQRVAEAALEAAVDPVALPSQALRIGLSLGIAATRTPVVAAEVFRAADKALYRAKEAGKGTFSTVDLDAARPEVVPPHAA